MTRLLPSAIGERHRSALYGPRPVDPKTRQSKLDQALLPGKKLVNRHVVARARIQQAYGALANGSHDFRLPMGIPSFGQITLSKNAKAVDIGLRKYLIVRDYT
jgi:hypothetical protein